VLKVVTIKKKDFLLLVAGLNNRKRGVMDICGGIY